MHGALGSRFSGTYGVLFAQPLMAMHAKTISSNFFIALVLVSDR